MERTTLSRLGRTLIIAATAALAVGCAADAPIAPDRGAGLRAAPQARMIAAGVARPGITAALPAGCDAVNADAGSTLMFRLYATGVQIYRWNGASWEFVAPSAALFADAEHTALVGTHSAGPTWRSVSGSEVAGAVAGRCTPNPDAIAWLRLDATPIGGAGMFEQVSSIQRVNTVGGKAPVTAGAFTGDEASVPYEAEYRFYRAP